MLLIDSLYINSSGGLLLLIELLKTLSARNISFYLLADKRCEGLLDEYNVEYLPASHLQRRSFYIRNKKRFSTVFCFGNIPPLIKLEVPVFTYFHNINLLTIKDFPTWRAKILGFFKREYIRYYRNNTDRWIVQTSNTEQELFKHFRESKLKIMVLPFYILSDSIESLKETEHGDDYVYVAYYSGAKGHEELLRAWEILSANGFTKRLHLTVNNNHPHFLKKIENSRKNGVNVINHGQVPFDRICELYKCSKAIIYPSRNESLGLGIIEAINSGCDVLGSDLPFIHAVCTPSETFNPYSPYSIANAVLKYEKGNSHKTELTISNSLDQLIELITRK